ncbi:hypothetical protein CO122_02135 [bacterium (Candidatus Gribaldobacteria) CG_4_9_14_3_um_filter_33_9]|nr:MAG: hypothetical protein CO122_02135 [bacterium (Candidatus Gribaldobacteria) CG_4_9_14_3_um_filter_33_9]
MPSRGLTYDRLNENGVIFLFSKVAEDLDITIEGIQVKFPDAFGKWYERPRALTNWEKTFAKLLDVVGYSY